MATPEQIQQYLEEIKRAGPGEKVSQEAINVVKEHLQTLPTDQQTTLRIGYRLENRDEFNRSEPKPQQELTSPTSQPKPAPTPFAQAPQPKPLQDDDRLKLNQTLAPKPDPGVQVQGVQLTPDQIRNLTKNPNAQRFHQYSEQYSPLGQRQQEAEQMYNPNAEMANQANAASATAETTLQQNAEVKAPEAGIVEGSVASAGNVVDALKSSARTATEKTESLPEAETASTAPTPGGRPGATPRLTLTPNKE